MRVINPLIALIGMACGVTCVNAQSRNALPTRDQQAVTSEARQGLTEQSSRDTAIFALTALADEVRQYDDVTLKSQTRARIADLLWDVDRATARDLLIRAWNSAKETLESTTNQSTALNRTAKLQAEILTLAFRHDRQLAADLMAELNEMRQPNYPEANSAGRHFDPTKPPPTWLSQRLAVSTQLLRNGDLDQAIAFAQPALAYVSVQGVAFLSLLREKKEATADTEFLLLMARAIADPLSDANTVSILSSYVFTPFLFFTANPAGGSGSSQLRSPAPVGSPPTRLAVSFLRSASTVLLRFNAAETQQQSTAGVAGTWRVIAHLLPLYEQYASDLAVLLRTKLAALNSSLPDALRTEITEALTETKPAPSENDPELELIDRLPTADARDFAYARAGFDAAKRGDFSYVRIIDRVSDIGLRQRVGRLADFTFAQNALRNKDPEPAIRIARESHLTEMECVWLLTEAANLVQKSDRTRTLQLLESALDMMNHIESPSVERVHALAALSASFVAIDKPRAWTLLAEAIAAANKIDKFSDNSPVLSETIETKSGVLSLEVAGANLTLRQIIQSFVIDNPPRALELARSIKSQTARTEAVLNVASFLLKSNRGAGSQQP